MHGKVHTVSPQISWPAMKDLLGKLSDSFTVEAIEV